LKFLAVLNIDSGTLSTVDLESYSEHLRQAFADHGHIVDVRTVKGEDIVSAMEQGFRDDQYDCIVSGGGDGTVSCAGAMAWRHGKPFGIIPAGTMNLYARTVGVPLEIWQAAEALAAGTIERCDIATANGRPFLHQLSVGMHARIVRERDRQSFTSRYSKMRASLITMLAALKNPPVFPVRLSGDGERRFLRVSSISVSNNRFGEGHLPYADSVDEGVLGIYLARERSFRGAFRFLVDMAFGSWRYNPEITELTAQQVTLEFPRIRRNTHAVVDGELIPLEPRIEISIHSGAVAILRPPARP
jgi:diacylglycerol kinase family enzyme